MVRAPLFVPSPCPDDPAACRILVPASASWKLAGGIPTGRKLPVDEERNLSAGQQFDMINLDTIFTDLAAAGDQVPTTIDDAHSGRQLKQTFDASFRHCVIFTRPHRQANAAEPYTAPPLPSPRRWTEGKQGFAS